MNLVIIMGRLTSDPDIRTSNDGKSIAKLSVAVNRKFKREGDADADFFNCVAFGKNSEFIEKYFHKGMKAVITGELRNNHYEKDGVKHYSEQIAISSIEFAESKSTSTPPADNSGFKPMDIDEELPFN